jgi:radical SAM superfamily enzyme YgiQ (UPF0313 family)
VVLPYLKQIGMRVHTTWTVGLPGETPDQAAATVAMIKRLYAAGLTQTHQLSGTATIEGTPLDRISKGEHLSAYAGADNRGFIVTGDGQAKAELLARFKDTKPAEIKEQIAQGYAKLAAGVPDTPEVKKAVKEAETALRLMTADQEEAFKKQKAALVSSLMEAVKKCTDLKKIGDALKALK